MVFRDYAKYYDLLYQDKDYQAESDYVMNLVNTHQPETKKILEFGSGSGIHGRILGNAGYQVSGVELSQQMIDLGKSSINEENQNPNFSCILGDCADTYISHDFDTAISLFHVVSYQTTNKKLSNVFKNAHRQLKAGGVFILDYWYAPAVWSIGPSIRVKRIKNQDLSITRIAEPECKRDQNIVKVKYQTFVEDRNTKCITEINETHMMRAFETEEISNFAKKSGFSLVHSEEWMTGKSPSKDSWAVCSILQKN
jgi:SAM-dependent methyltransferase